MKCWKVHLMTLVVSSVFAAPIWGQDASETKDPPAVKIPVPQQQQTDSNPIVLLNNLIERMQRVRKNLAARTVDDATAQDQQQIVKDIDRLIEIAKQQQPNQQPSSEPNNQQPGNQQRSQSQQNESQSEQRSNQPQESDPDTQQGSTDRKSEANQDENQAPDGNVQQATAAQAEASRQQVLIRQHWGHLPVRLRERIMNLADQKYLPRYEERIRQYYQSLAEKNRSAKRNKK